jgi:hypothetical protein
VVSFPAFHLCDPGSIPARSSYLIKNIFHIHMWEERFQLDFAKRRRFSPGTPVSSCSNTGPWRDGPNWTSTENSLVKQIELSSIN